jgi:anti-sigma-K factor RskA
LKHETATGSVQGTAALYALGSLGQHEARVFESHLRDGCAICESELRHFEQVASGIGLGAQEVKPPEYLRDLLAARFEQESQAAPPTAHANAADVKIKETPKSLEPPIFKQVQPQVRRNAWPWIAAVIFAIAAAILFFFWKRAEDSVGTLKRQADITQRESDDLRTSRDAQQQRAEELDRIQAFLSSQDSRVISIEEQPPAPSATAAIFWNTQKNRWLVVGFLPPPPEGRVYQLWLSEAPEKSSIALLKTDALGNIFAEMDAPASVSKPASAIITLEPEGGSKQPTMPIYALGKLTSSNQ